MDWDTFYEFDEPEFALDFYRIRGSIALIARKYSEYLGWQLQPKVITILTRPREKIEREYPEIIELKPLIHSLEGIIDRAIELQLIESAGSERQLFANAPVSISGRRRRWRGRLSVKYVNKSLDLEECHYLWFC